MIEIIYNKEKESAVGNEEYFCMPRNIRQVGQPSQEWKIYVEDYVYSFLSRVGAQSEEKGRMAILLGTNNWKDGIFYIFIKSCLLVDSIEKDEGYLAIRDDVWGKIYEEMKRFFPGQDVIGWYLDRPGGNVVMTDIIKRIHLTHFGGNDKVLYLADTIEQDNTFFVYKNGQMERQTGYYIFYEKNEAMRDYILEKSPGVSVDYTGKPQDLAVNDFRKIIAQKRAEKETKKADKVFRMATTAAAVAVLVLSVMWVRNTPFGEKIVTVLKKETQVRDVEKVEPSDVVSGTESVDVIEEDVIVEETIVEELPDENFEKEDVQSINLREGLLEYTIRPGDTLCKISVRYYGDSSKVDEICKINSMTQEDIIYEGQKILLP